MSFKFSCPKCGKHIEAEDHMAGGVCDCPGCRESIEVPEEPSLHRPMAPAALGLRPDEPLAVKFAQPVRVSISDQPLRVRIEGLRLSWSEVFDILFKVMVLAIPIAIIIGLLLGLLGLLGSMVIMFFGAVFGGAK